MSHSLESDLLHVERPLHLVDAQESRYAQLFELNPHPAWVYDEGTLKIVHGNEAFLRKYGYSHTDIVGMNLREVIPAEDVDRILLEGTPGKVWKQKNKSGVVLTTEIVSVRIVFAERPMRLVVAELAERLKTESELREREGFLRSVLAHIPCGVFWKDRASIYLGCNDRVARDHGLEVAGEVIGLTDYEILPEEEAEAIRTEDRAVYDSSTPKLNAEENRTFGNGTKVSLLTSRVPLRDGTGKTIGVLGVYQDVTERKRLEEQLRQAQKMEAIGRLAGGIAHDFNNLLTIILGNVDRIRSIPPGAPEIRELITDIHDAADRAASLTRQLLTFSRRQPSRSELFDVNEVVGGLSGLIKRLIGDRIRVTTELSPHPARIRGDRSQLEQVVMNLAVNAKDAMAGGGELSIRTTTANAPPGFRTPNSDHDAERIVVLSVSDTGSGMSPEVQAKIFEPFFTTKEVGKGTGLGLATVYGIVERTGGRIEVDSTLGVGTTFRILFPCSDAVAPMMTMSSFDAFMAKAIAGSGRQVLLVDDEEAIRKLARFTLESEGYTVTEAEHGDAALRELNANSKFDLLLVDLVMPGMDGRELAAKVREIVPGIGLVFISGYIPDTHRLQELPGALFLPKPFTPGDLVNIADCAIRKLPWVARE